MQYLFLFILFMVIESRTDITNEDQEILDFLAATFRFASSEGWSEGVRSHFSAEISGNRIAVQNQDVSWHSMTRDDLILFHINTTEPPPGVSLAAFFIHQKLHQNLKSRAKAILHVHAPFSSLLSCTLPGKLEMIHQNTCYFYDNVGYLDYPDTGTEMSEVAISKLIESLGNENRVVLQANHGVFVIGETVSDAFDDLYYFENASKIYYHALMTGKPLKYINNETCGIIMKMRNDQRGELGRRHLISFMQGKDKETCAINK